MPITFKFPAALVLVQALAASTAFADLREASTPKNGFQIQDPNANNDKGTVPGGFVQTGTTVYMEPSTFGYKGLENQKANNYDNFLRSNIDNEQDNRNFNTEPGKDNLPFRTLEAASAGAVTEVACGQETMVPLRWNNPHSSEMEVNIWVKGNTVVVPVKKPVCSGEGHQNSVVTYTIPADFEKDVAAAVSGFNGCKALGDCTLQIYAHSVEPRTYAIGVPITLKGCAAIGAKAADDSKVLPTPTDVGLDLSKLAKDTCMPMTDPASNIAAVKPQAARLVSDQFNHAYQNSNFSPYSGQQPTEISKNLQASAIIRMTVGNRGELGKSVLTAETKEFRRKLATKANQVVRGYERTANGIINRLQNQDAFKNSGTIGAQQLANGFRVNEVGAISSERLTTTTYIPSFALPAAKAAEVKAALADKYKTLVSDNNVVQIYVAALNDLKADFDAAAAKGLKYMPAMIKSTVGTMNDVTQFRKVDAAGKQDGGKYAATAAYRAAGIQFPAALAEDQDELSDFDKAEAGIADAEALEVNPDSVGSADDADDQDGYVKLTKGNSAAATASSVTIVGAAIATVWYFLL